MKIHSRLDSEPVLPDFDTAVALNMVRGFTQILVHGVNSDLDSTPETIWEVGGVIPDLTAASQLKIQAGGDSADDVDGTGARKIRLFVLNEDMSTTITTLITNGIDESLPTAASYWALNRTSIPVQAFDGDSVGSNGANIGDITIVTHPAGVAIAIIKAGEGVAHNGFWTTGKDERLILKSIQVSPESQQDTEMRVVISSGIGNPGIPIRRTEWAISGLQDPLSATGLSVSVEPRERFELRAFNATPGSVRMTMTAWIVDCTLVGC